MSDLELKLRMAINQKNVDYLKKLLEEGRDRK